MSDSSLERAARAVADGELVVYPTETVYGLGADATDPDAVERVFAAKGRDRSKPISFGVPDVESALEYVRASDRERAFVREFLPGPVTVLCERRGATPDGESAHDRGTIPDVLTAGRDRVGVRVPDCEPALELLERAAVPVTATSANVSGRPSARRVADLDPEIEEACAAVLEGGETPGTESTVVDVSTGTIHRRGALADEIEAWLDGR